MNGRSEDSREQSPGNRGESPQPGESSSERSSFPAKGDLPLKSIVEALVFASDEPLSIQRIRSILPHATAKEIRKAIEDLNSEYDSCGHAFTIEEVADGYRMYTRPEFESCLRDFFRHRKETRLTVAAIETLAIIAYRQPVERAVIEDIRGVNSEGVIKNLMERGLVKIMGRSSKLGHPLLYGTTKRFLEHFGLKSIKDLPKVSELTGP